MIVDHECHGMALRAEAQSDTPRTQPWSCHRDTHPGDDVVRDDNDLALERH
jgi:hypothetical protein